VSTLTIRIDRALGVENALAAVVRVSDEHGHQRSYPCRVGPSAANTIEVNPGLSRVDLRLPNGHREQKLVRIEPGGDATVTFTPPPSPHEFLAVQSFVSQRKFRRESLSEENVPGQVPIEVAARIESLAITPPHFFTFDAIDVPLSNGYVDFGVPGIHVVSTVVPDAIRLGFHLYDWNMYNRFYHRHFRRFGFGPFLLVRERVGSRLVIQLPPFERFDIVLHPNDKPHGPTLDAEIVVTDPEIASLLGFLALADADSADAMLDEILGSDTAPDSNLGLAITEGYALLALRRFLAPTAENVLPYVQGPAQKKALDLVINRLNVLRAIRNFDGAVLWASVVMQAEPGRWREWFDEVFDALIEYPQRGPGPMFTRGFDLWLDGLTQLAMLYQALPAEKVDPKRKLYLDDALEMARWTIATLRRNEIFTTRWFGKDDLRWRFLRP